MATHRPSYSSATGLQLPSQDSSPQQRRMSLGLPEGARKPSPRPPSPLRNGYVMNTSTGIDPHDDDSEDEEEEDEQDQWRRSPSPSSSVSHLAASFVQRVNHFVGGMAPKSPSLPSDAELEAEGEREREHTRREAEAIMSREANERKLVEDRVLEMLGSARSLPPPPSRAQTMPNPPSPAGSQKSGSWWEVAKNKLTPTKELTAAQQIVQDAKTREKEERRLSKTKDKGRANEWPAKPDTKFSDPAFANLNIPVAPPTRKPVPPSPSSPTPSRPSLSNMPPNLTPSPMRVTDSLTSSPAREAPPIYAQFNAQGTLDVAGTLLAIAKRFEKLEKWTVGHVRALEDRMNDVERWLVDKEKEKDKQDTGSVNASSSSESVTQDLHEIREEMSELQGRVGELGREMAKLATSPSNLSSGPKTQTVAVSHAAAPSTTSVLVQQHTGSSLPSTPHQRLASATARDSTSPPMASSRRTPSGTRLPYPTGDYTSPSDAFSPTNSPPGSLSASSRTKPLSISGLPNTSGPLSTSSLSYGAPRTMSPSPSSGARAVSPTPSPNNGLPPPRSMSPRASSVSPTPRKRYTVALGDRITRSPSNDDFSSNAAPTPPPDPPKRSGTPKSFARPSSSIEATFFSNGNGNGNGNGNNDDDDDDDNEYGDETIGKSLGSKLASSGTFSNTKGDYKVADDSPSPSMRRIRAQSAYGFSNISGANGTTHAATLAGSNGSGGLGTPTVAPLKTRSKSSERLNTRSSTTSLSSPNGGTGTGDGMVSALGGSTKFVDPLVLRKQSRDTLGSKPIAMPRPVSGKIPVDRLVAFFEKDKK